MTAATETKKSAIKEEVTTLAQRIQDSLKLDHETGVAVPTTEIYKEAAHEAGLTQETIGQVKKFETTVCAAATLAIGQIGIKAMEKHKDLNHVQANIPMYGDESFSAGIHRETTSRNVSTGEPLTIYGQTHTSFSITSSANKGQMAKVRSSLKELASESLNKGK